jgi:hypothetical protein
MRFTNVRYIDASLSSNGDGLAPATAFNNIPGADSLENDTLYIIKRSQRPTDFATGVWANWPVFGSFKSGKTKMGFIGAPQQGTQEYYALPQSEQTKLDTAGWSTSTDRYAQVKCVGTNNINFAYSTMKDFFMRDINLERDPETTDFDQTTSSASGRWLIFFTGGVNLVDIKRCRFSAFGVDLDDPAYINGAPVHKCCAYMRVTGGGSLIMEENVINWLGKSYGSEAPCYDAFGFSGGGTNLSFSNNKVYFTLQNTTSYIYNNTSNTQMRGRWLLSIDENILDVGRVNGNEFVFRCSDYQNMPGLIYFPFHRYFEFKDNYVHSGVHMGNYDFTTLKCRQHQMNMFSFSYDSRTYCYDYCITNNKIILPEVWNVFGCCMFHMDNRNHTSDRSSEGMYWGYGQKKFEDMEIILGEGPAVNEISSSDMAVISAQRNSEIMGFGGGSAIYFRGYTTWESYSHYHVANQGNSIKGLKVSHPWGTAVRLECVYAEIPEVRGSVVFSTASYLKIDTMTLKAPYSKSIYNESFGNVIIGELFVEDVSVSQFIDSNSTRFGIQIDKQNIPAIDNSVAWWPNNGYYNESFILQKDIGDSHKFLYRSLNRFIESSNAKRNGTNTLKIYGYKSRTENYPLSVIGSDAVGIASRTLSPGRYIIRVHSAFYGPDLVENTITTPANNQKNVYQYYKTGIRTKWTYYNAANKVTVADGGWDWTYVLNQFYEEYFVDVYEESDVYLQLEQFSVNSDNFETGNPTAAVFLDPNLEVIRVGDVGTESNSSSTAG